MSEYTFKNLNEVETVTEPADGTTVMGFEAGKAIQMPMSTIKSGGGEVDMSPFIIDVNRDSNITGSDVRDALLTGRPIWIYDKKEETTRATADHYFLVNSFYITSGTSPTAGAVIPIQSAGGSAYTIHLKYIRQNISDYLAYAEYLCYVSG